MYFKVVTKGMMAPGKINFAFGEGQFVRTRRITTPRSNEPGSPASPSKPKIVFRSKVELSAYFSVNDKNREPTKENCDKVIDSPSGSILMPIHGKDRFENEEVYMSLFSLTGCTVYLTPSFPDPVSLNYMIKKQVKEDYADETDFENFLVCKNWRKLNKNKFDKDSYIKGHVELVKNFPTLKAKRAQGLSEKRSLMA